MQMLRVFYLMEIDKEYVFVLYNELTQLFLLILYGIHCFDYY